MILTVVGRALRRPDFERALESHLTEGFTIVSIIPLDQDGEAQRFLSYVQSSDEIGEDIAEMSDTLEEWYYSVDSFDTIEEAEEFARETYSKVAYAAFNEEPLSAAELFKRDMLAAFIHVGDIGVVRGLLHDKPVAVMTHISTGEGPNDQTGTPLAILVDDEMGENLILPIRSSYDK